MDFDDDDDLHSNGGDHWTHKYTNWEEECIGTIESLPDLETVIEDEKGKSAPKLWLSFQNAACCVAQLYKDREQNVSLWIPFQNAASGVTSLYKECIESQKRFTDLGLQCGVQKRNKEILSWVKKKKRNIRREDLIAFLSGRNAPNYGHHHLQHHYHHRSWSSPKQRLTLPDAVGTSRHVASGGRTPPHHGITLTRLTLAETLSDPPPNLNESSPDDEKDLETFREALALSVSGLRNSPQHNSRRNTVTRLSNNCSNNSSYAELNAFITEEFNRHVESHKRSASSSDVTMDSPTHKRSKYI